ncbi:MAG: hypothetical protein Q9219_005449 [cf. Caloplaca sp. 3 TL-2023]
MCWLTAWTFRCSHIWTVQSGSCAHPFTPSCKLHETRTVVPELCRDCRVRELEAQAPVFHDDVVVEEEEDEGGDGGGGGRVVAREKEMGGGKRGGWGGERELLLGGGKGRGRKGWRGWSLKREWLR